MAKLWYLDIRTLPEGLPGLERVSPGRRARILRAWDVSEQRRLLAAGLLLGRCLPSPEDACLQTAQGKPYLPGGPEFSISHSGTLAVLLAAEMPCGVDAEPFARRPQHASRMLTQAESIWLAAENGPFSRLWTRKEAVMKACGLGLQIRPEQLDVLADTAAADGKTWHLATREVEGYCVSWAAEAPLMPEICPVRPEDVL